MYPPACYRGRFAPSPTGPLHLGSLLTAVASYLDARHRQGEWLIRIEDLDPPREQPGASDMILRSLEFHGLIPDRPVLFQSQRHPRYHQILQQLLEQQLAFYCQCSRQQIQEAGGIYPGTCRTTPPAATQHCAIRLKTKGLPAAYGQLTSMQAYVDALQGEQSQDLASEVGDFIIFRKDGFFAYQLAVVIDDIDQGITHILRGADLLDNTPRQLWLYQLLQHQFLQLQPLHPGPPEFGHLPVIVNPEGQKLSKQTYAPAIDDSNASANLCSVLALLNHPVPAHLCQSSPESLLHWAGQHWNRTKIPPGLRLLEPFIASPEPLK